MSNSFEYDGVDAADYDVTVMAAEETFVPAVDVTAVKIPGQSRYVEDTSTYGERRIELPIVVTGTSREDLQSNLTGLAALLNRPSGAWLKVDDLSDQYGLDVWWWARLDGEMKLTRTNTVARGTIVMVARDPHGYGEAVEVGNTWPGEPLTITPAGSADAAPSLVFTAAGTVSGVVLENSSRDERIAWTGALAAGNQIMFDCEGWNAYYRAAAEDDWTLSNGGVSGVFPMLTAGEENLINLLSPAAGTLTVTYQPRYL